MWARIAVGAHVEDRDRVLLDDLPPAVLVRDSRACPRRSRPSRRSRAARRRCSCGRSPSRCRRCTSRRRRRFRSKTYWCVNVRADQVAAGGVQRSPSACRSCRRCRGCRAGARRPLLRLRAGRACLGSFVPPDVAPVRASSRPAPCAADDRTCGRSASPSAPRPPALQLHGRAAPVAAVGVITQLAPRRGCGRAAPRPRSRRRRRCAARRSGAGEHRDRQSGTIGM